jgi:hypothetical protein
MEAGAHTPEELEVLLEDAFLMRDGRALGVLFESAAVLSGSDRSAVARGRQQIVRAAAEMWVRDELYHAAPLRVVQARGTALIAGQCSTSVARRSADGAWRYRIALVHPQPQRPRSR